MNKLRKKYWRVTGLAGLLAILPWNANADNLLKNSDFSAVTDGVPNEWLPYANKQTLALDTQEITGASKQSLRVDIIADGGKEAMGQIVQKVPVSPNKKYEFSVDIKSSADGTGIGQIKLLSGSKELKRIQTAKSATDWKPVKLAFDSGEATMVWVVLRYHQRTENVGQKIWFANASMTMSGDSPAGESAAVPAASSAPATAGPTPVVTPVEPSAVPTYESIGLYWKPVSGATDNACTVNYRASGEKDWKEALPLWFDPTDHPNLPENSLEYRGSIVHLKPGMAYEIKLRLAKDGTEKLLNVKTWSDDFKVAKTVTLAKDAPQPYVISEGGSKETGYVVYTCEPGVVLDGKSEVNNNIEVKASFVILRGLTMKDAKINGIELGDVQDVVIENCDVSGWGRVGDGGFGVNLDSAIYSKSKALTRVTMQGNQLHNPRSNSNSWTESRMHDGKATKHPIGPQGISFLGCQGNLVIRHNKIYSDPQHKYNDSMGEVKNFSYGGFPNRDSDVYENDISNTYDDGIEMEGADMNVRVWNNRFDDVYGAVGCATSSLGPIYIYRNVMHSARKGPKDDADSNKGAYLVKLGTENENYAKGKIFIFHNTMLQPPPRGTFTETSGGNAGLIATGPSKHQINITSRNNILFVRDAMHSVIKDYFKDPTNDYDYDLYNGIVSAADGMEKNGVKATPEFDTSTPGVYPLKKGTPGIDAGVRLPNFNDDFSGKAPDVGAFESK